MDEIPITQGLVPLVAGVAGVDNPDFQAIAYDTAHRADRFISEYQTKAAAIRREGKLTDQGKQAALKELATESLKRLPEAIGAPERARLQKDHDRAVAGLRNRVGALDYPPGTDAAGMAAHEAQSAEILERMLQQTGGNLLFMPAAKKGVTDPDLASAVSVARAIRFRLQHPLDPKVSEEEWRELHWAFMASREPKLAKHIGEQEATLQVLDTNANRVTNHFFKLTGLRPESDEGGNEQ
jgi:hypothetical protein